MRMPSNATSGGSGSSPAIISWKNSSPPSERRAWAGISCSRPRMLVSSRRLITRRRSMSQTPRPTQPGRFLTFHVGPGDVFTREDLTAEQKLFGQTAAEFMRRDVLPNAPRLYDHDWSLTRELLRKAGELDLLRLEIPEVY